MPSIFYQQKASSVIQTDTNKPKSLHFTVSRYNGIIMNHDNSVVSNRLDEWFDSLKG